jgi:hypothetical protein
VGYVVVYVDDICIFTKTDDPQEHLEKLEKVLDSLRQHDLLVKGIKCSLFRTEMEFLGILVSADVTRPIPSKVETVVRMTPPETVSQLRSFLGMISFFASHITVFSERASPLTDLLRGVTTCRQLLLWTPRCNQDFRDLKSGLISTPVLRGFDPLLRTVVHVDGSQSGVGTVLLQWEEGQQDPRPVCFLSPIYKSLSSNTILITLWLLLSRLIFRNVGHCCMEYHLKCIRIIVTYTISSRKKLRLNESYFGVSS